MRYFIYTFYTKTLKSSVYFIFTEYFNLDEPHFKRSLVICG